MIRGIGSVELRGCVCLEVLASRVSMGCGCIGGVVVQGVQGIWKSRRYGV